MSFTLPILIMSFSPLMAAVSQVASFDGWTTEQLYCEEYRQWTSLSGIAAALNRPLKPWVSGQCNVWSGMHSPDYSGGPRQVIPSRLRAFWELNSKTVTDRKYFTRHSWKDKNIFPWTKPTQRQLWFKYIYLNKSNEGRQALEDRPLPSYRQSDACMTVGRPFAFPAPFAWVQA